MVLTNILITILHATPEKCECGMRCEMPDGVEGICHKSGRCKPVTIKPDCGPKGKLLNMISH